MTVSGSAACVRKKSFPMLSVGPSNGSWHTILLTEVRAENPFSGLWQFHAGMRSLDCAGSFPSERSCFARDDKVGRRYAALKGRSSTASTGLSDKLSTRTLSDRSVSGAQAKAKAKVRGRGRPRHTV